MTAVLDSHTRRIRNIQITRASLLPLVSEINKDKRIPCTTIDAFGARVQELHDLEGGANFCIFPSWVAGLANGKVSKEDERHIGSLFENIMAAVSVGIIMLTKEKYVNSVTTVPVGNQRGINCKNTMGDTPYFAIWRQDPTPARGRPALGAWLGKLCEEGDCNI
jgi:hypothetical protein